MPRRRGYRYYGGGGTPMGEMESSILLVCWSIAGVIFVVISPLMLIISVFSVDFVEKFYLLLIKTAFAFIFVAILFSAIHCCWTVCSGFDAFKSFWELLVEILLSPFALCWHFLSTSWTLLVAGTKIAIYGTPALGYF
jgi:hypothetical protein